MNLYRLDYIDANGKTMSAVQDSLWRGAYLTRHAKIARTVAIERCSMGPRGSKGIAITRISGAGYMKRTFIVDKYGRVQRA